MTITPIVIHLVFPLRDYIGGTTHLHDQSNSQLKLTKYWDRLIVELLAFVSFKAINPRAPTSGLVGSIRKQ